jgi:hypothetical protein
VALYPMEYDALSTEAAVLWGEKPDPRSAALCRSGEAVEAQSGVALFEEAGAF